MIEYVGKCLLVKEKEIKILVIGDLHLGYEEALNRAGILVTRKMFEEMIGYLEIVLEKVGRVDEVVLLGDVKHSFGWEAKQEKYDSWGLFDYLESKCKKLIVIKGNHDMEGGYAKKVLVKDFYVVGSFCFLHGDRDFGEIRKKKVKYWVIGHAHPAVKIKDIIKKEKYKCFLEGKFKDKKVILVPSFLDYTVGSDPREYALKLAWPLKLNEFRVHVVQDESLEVLQFGKLKEIN